VSAQKPLQVFEFARVAIDHPSAFAGRTGIVQAIDGDVVALRFSAKRTFPFALKDLRRVVGGVRR
jgi:hypothetical protein